MIKCVGENVSPRRQTQYKKCMNSFFFQSKTYCTRTMFFFCWNKQNSITALNQIYYPLEHLCGMTLSNLRGCQMSDFDLKGVGEHNGDTGCILSEKNLNQRLGGGFHDYQALYS